MTTKPITPGSRETGNGTRETVSLQRTRIPPKSRERFFRFWEASSEKEGAVDPVSLSFGMLGISF